MKLLDALLLFGTLASLVARVVAQNAVCNPLHPTTQCTGYAVPLSAHPFFTIGSNNLSYVFDDVTSQCPVCATRWITTTLTNQGQLMAAQRCSYCCASYGECITASGRLQGGDTWRAWDTPNPAYSWDLANAPQPPSTCSARILPSGALASLASVECNVCRAAPWRSLDTTNATVSAAALAAGLNFDMLGLTGTVCQCATSCWPLSQYASLPANSTQSQACTRTRTVPTSLWETKCHT